MGSLSLVCPMCCGETFDDSQSLKYHLLSMTDNLYCPNCADRFDSVAALIQHLDCCGEALEKNSPGAEDAGCDVEKDGGDNNLEHGFLATMDDDGDVIAGEPPTIEMDEDGEIRVVNRTETSKNTSKSSEDAENVEDLQENSFEMLQELETDQVEERRTDVKEEKSARAALLPDDPEEIVEPEEEEDERMEAEDSSPIIGVEPADDKIEELEDSSLLRVKQEICEEESEALYSCSSCGMSFNSVLEHIKEYHDGQEVVLEMAEQQMEDLPEEVDAGSAVTLDCEEIATKPDGGPGGGDDETTASTTSSSSLVPRQRQTMNTLRTEECVDSEGRLYTRKVVQIERFWDRGSVAVSQLQLQQHQQAAKSGPMIEKFFSNVEGVKVRAKSPTSRSNSASSGSAAAAAGVGGNVLPQRMYRCNKCLEQFSKLNDFRVHACSEGSSQCDLCDRTFASAKALQLHSRVHDGDAGADGSSKHFVCPICATQFSSHKSLRLHSRMHAPVRARHVDAPEGTAHGEFTCLDCGKTLSESYRKAHMALHKGDSVTCTVCNRKFDSSDSLAMHAAVHLEPGQSQQQQQQQQQTPLSQEQQQQQQQQTQQEESSQGLPSTGDVGAESVQDSQKPYQCQHCGRRFTRPHEKVKHERIHTGEKPHACEVCGKTFRVSYCLTLHMRTHTGVRPYACQHCGKRFKASSVYNHHLLTHGEERAYTCPFCPKTFKTRVQLAGHKNSHTKPFRCTECSRPFASLYAARAHIQTHKKDNNFKFSCYICGASYGRAFALKDHLKVHAVQDALAAPEPAREEEVAEAEDYLIAEVDELEELEEIDDEERQLVSAAVTAAVPPASVVLHHRPSE